MPCLSGLRCNNLINKSRAVSVNCTADLRGTNFLLFLFLFVVFEEDDVLEPPENGDDGLLSGCVGVE
jgi:hypothetical protein